MVLTRLTSYQWNFSSGNMWWIFNMRFIWCHDFDHGYLVHHK